MKISAEVREFARLQDAGLLNSGAADPESVEAEAGMAEMSERYREAGSELYVGANGRTHD